MSQGTEKIWLKDDQGNYYMLTQEILDAVKVPEANKKEVDEVVGGQDDTVGYASFGTLATSRLTLGSRNLSVLGKCMCGRNFGVNTQLFRR